MTIDHIFIILNDGGRIADQLVNFGLKEGSSRDHPGQGTTNRKFYFKNFYLEVLWVHNEEEFRSNLICPTGLWERVGFKNNDYSGFGLCLLNTDKTDILFENAIKYQPEYFPKGSTIEILKNETNPGLPWIFRLPPKEQDTTDLEPTTHDKELCYLTKATFEIPDKITEEGLKNLQALQQVEFVKSHRSWLTLTFDHRERDGTVDFKEMRLTIEY